MKIAVLLVALALAPACDRDAPTAPTPAVGPYTGSWTGAVGDDINGTGTMRVELTELTIDATRSLLGGAWRTTFADSSRNATGFRSSAALASISRTRSWPRAPAP